ncbi:MAG: glycolate oxidase subunit GlcE [Thiotrichaceae bacterium]|nr:MAG: glycolate oxidase subunit GlcE [Thiotrichaceae bacterium]
MNTDISQQLQQRVQSAFEQAASKQTGSKQVGSKQTTALQIIGGGSKNFYGNTTSAQALNVSGHSGVLNYEPTELVITARAGTLLSDIEKLLENNGQMLPFEPPAYSATATLGGTIACNLSGPRRATAGAARDFLLGCKIINGKGEILSFGGEVMKNVAGYDVSRLMAGAMGTLGVLLEVSLKVLPKAESESTQVFQCNFKEASEKTHSLSRTALPVSATCYHDSILRIRLSGTHNAVAAAMKSMGGDTMESASNYWHSIKEQQHDFFNTEKSLWRLSLASNIENISLGGDVNDDNSDSHYLHEWGGALRWLKTDIAGDKIQRALEKLDGQATLFRNRKINAEQNPIIFQPLSPGLLQIHKKLKLAFDPENILNPGKQYPDL